MATIPQEIDQLKDRAAWWESQCESLKDRIAELEGKKRSAGEQQRQQDEEMERAAIAELRRARAAAIRALVKLLPEAVRQAKAKPPKPALLRMILRATR